MAIPSVLRAYVDPALDAQYQQYQQQLQGQLGQLNPASTADQQAAMAIFRQYNQSLMTQKAQRAQQLERQVQNQYLQSQAHWTDPRLVHSTEVSPDKSSSLPIEVTISRAESVRKKIQTTASSLLWSLLKSLPVITRSPTTSPSTKTMAQTSTPAADHSTAAAPQETSNGSV